MVIINDMVLAKENLKPTIYTIKRIIRNIDYQTTL
jgi:hypothetical protein